MRRYQCPGCGYVYDEQVGDAHEGFSPGTSWALVPDDWACPDCAVRDKADFIPVDASTPVQPPTRNPGSAA